MKCYYVYILASLSKVLYIGMTNDLEARIRQHKSRKIRGFTSKYNVTRLVYFEEFETALEAIHREKELKGWNRKKKIALIKAQNLTWKDLSGGWYVDE